MTKAATAASTIQHGLSSHANPNPNPLRGWNDCCPTACWSLEVMSCIVCRPHLDHHLYSISIDSCSKYSSARSQPVFNNTVLFVSFRNILPSLPGIENLLHICLLMFVKTKNCYQTLKTQRPNKKPSNVVEMKGLLNGSYLPLLCLNGFSWITWLSF